MNNMLKQEYFKTEMTTSGHAFQLTVLATRQAWLSYDTVCL